MFTIEGKIALVTGAARGIGFGYAKELLRNGARGVSLVDINKQNGKKAIEELTKEFGLDKVIFYQCDITELDKFKSIFESSFAHWSGLDILINNAGILNERKLNESISLNCTATVNSTYLGFECMSKMKGGNGGVIINISSIAGISPSYLSPLYSATKSFIASFSCAMGTNTYYKHNEIRILTVCPGVTDTEIFDDYTNKILNNLSPNLEKEYGDVIRTAVTQTANHVAQCVMRVIVKGKNGSVWVINNNEVEYETEGLIKEITRKQ
ncbi:hypothetical protein FQA39_LY07696 [Lamprigera yunnana]|nr:hypothetical protein FQA39_LY07696 [Lamprigera yunnana]